MVKASAKGVLRAEWKRAFKEVVGGDLESVASAIASKYYECMTHAGVNPEECLRTAARDAGLGDLYRGVYGRRHSELKGETAYRWNMALSALGDALKAKVKGLIADAYRDCMRQTGKSAKDCFSDAARTAKLGEELSRLWNTMEFEV